MTNFEGIFELNEKETPVSPQAIQAMVDEALMEELKKIKKKFKSKEEKLAKELKKAKKARKKSKGKKGKKRKVNANDLFLKAAHISIESGLPELFRSWSKNRNNPKN